MMDETKSTPPEISKSLPGSALVQQGIDDLFDGTQSVPALLLCSARTKFSSIGIDLPKIDNSQPALSMYEMLAKKHGNGAHSKYNALRRELVSFFRASVLVQAN